MSSEPTILGLDFGGTKLAAGLVDQSGRLLTHGRRSTPAQAGADAVIAEMYALASDVIGERRATLCGVGVNFGGPVDADRGVVRTSRHVPGWHDTPLAALVAEKLAVPCVLENDANGQALAEWRFGAGRGSKRMVYFNVGTGIGGGVVLDGALFRGAHGLAGEFGHMVVRANGPRCTCGRAGCLEALCAGPAMGRRARAALAPLTSEERQKERLVRLAGTWEEVSGRHLTQAAADGDALALEVLDGIFNDLASGVATVAAVLDPDVFVFGGGAMAMSEQLFARLLERSRRSAMPELAPTLRLMPAQLGETVGVLGGVAAFLDRFPATFSSNSPVGNPH